jgi:membrane protease YdiL (CAAX protease family)
MPLPFDHALAALLAIFFPIWAATLGFRRLKRATLETLPRVRRSVYATAMVIQWGLIAVVAVLWVTTRRAWSELGLVPIPSPGLIGVLVGLAIVVVFIVRQRRGLLADEDGLELVRRRLRNIERMMPRTPGELRGFFALSVTAGVCEEILYRGYMIWYLTHFLGLIPAALVAAAVFGLGHSYQGPRGVLLTGAVGAFLGGIYLVTGSLFVPMVVHALMDIHSGHLGYVAFRAEDQSLARAAREPLFDDTPGVDGAPVSPEETTEQPTRDRAPSA